MGFPKLFTHLTNSSDRVSWLVNHCSLSRKSPGSGCHWCLQLLHDLRCFDYVTHLRHISKKTHNNYSYYLIVLKLDGNVEYKKVLLNLKETNDTTNGRDATNCPHMSSFVHSENTKAAVLFYNVCCQGCKLNNSRRIIICSYLVCSGSLPTLISPKLIWVETITGKKERRN